MWMKVIAYLGYSRDLFCVFRESRKRDNYSVDFMNPDLSTGYKLFGLNDGSLLGQLIRRLGVNTQRLNKRQRLLTAYKVN